jgi:hypothetical protein
VHVQVPVTRRMYESLIRADAERAVDICRTLLKNNRLAPKQVEKLILIGGPSKTPLIQHMLSDALGIPLESSVDPMTAVAEGAAIYADTIEAPLTDDDTPKHRPNQAHSLRIECERHSPVPTYCAVGLVDGPPLDGARVEFERLDGYWKSGGIPVDGSGVFTADLTLIESDEPTLSQFRTTLLDRAGKTVATLDGPHIWYPYPAVENRLASAGGIEKATSEDIAALVRMHNEPREGYDNLFELRQKTIDELQATRDGCSDILTRQAAYVPPSQNVASSRMDKVHFSVSCQPAITPGETGIVDVWAHLERQRVEVTRRIHQQASPVVHPHPVIRSKGPFSIGRGTRLFVRLRCMEFHVEPSEDVILWDGDIGNASFEVSVPEDIAVGPKVAWVTIHCEGGLQVAGVPINILVAAKTHTPGPVAQSVHRIHHVRKAFASYASVDRDEVLGRIQGMQKVAPDLDVFLDVVSLRSGDDWESKLSQVIPQNDVFYLFWSAAAKASPWVEREWRCALSTRGENFIDPVPLVSPEEVRPPDELSKRHFGDWTLAYRRGRGGRTGFVS